MEVRDPIRPYAGIDVLKHPTYIFTNETDIWEFCEGTFDDRSLTRATNAPVGHFGIVDR